ncbi:transporter substrate-binding domain-containing protein [Tissierella sp. MB52-C2]|uniref:transporter substrate-binding domain-containing protein n=1 Tax=Tissierella sp. MB52-C2 TaxID=3070999 RepID=UPI00280B0FE9|nr:transporter substrate-binding domain-containing protein [Tissierella sp. MB52-C2]WMM24869.1 transporter substrate-binding domain-containing protein [Tissierella sp. MB52-C2]
MQSRLDPVILLLAILLVISSKSLCINDDEIIIIGGEKNYPPFEYLDEDGEYRGFNVDLMKALSLEVGVEIKLVPMDWVDAHVALQNGSIDAIQGMNYNDARLAMYDFSNEYLKNSLVCFVRKDETKILGVDSLIGRRVAVQRSDFAAYALADKGEIEVVFFSDLDIAFEKLIKGEVDAVVGNKLTGLYIIQKNRSVDLIKTVGNDISFTSYGMAFKKGNNQLMNEFNQALESLKKKGTYYNIYEKWFGKEIKPAWKGLLNLLYILLFIIIIVILINLFFIRINSILKKEVELRTINLNEANEELNKKQQIIKESNRYKEQILNGIGNGLITFDKEGIITTLNKSCENLLNINSEEFIGMRYDEVDLERYIHINHLKECLRYEKQFNIEEKRYYQGNKENILSYILRPLFDLNNENIGAVVTFNDITEISILRRKLAENDKMNSLGTLISGISHEIRNPLTSIKAYIDLLPKKYDNIEFRKKITTEIPTEIERLNELLTDLIDYSRPKKFKKENFDLIHLVNQTIDIFISEMESQGIDINYLIEDEVILYGDKQQIKQIIVNILKNSMEAVNFNGKIVIDVEDTEEQAILSILDNGQGIMEEDLNNILNPFFTTKDNGTGLGLALCYQYAKDNNTNIKINSKYGEWTKIDLVFTKS